MTNKELTLRRRDDHDILIEIRGQVNQTVLDVASVRSDIKDLKDNTAKRVSDLESEKLDKDDMIRMKEEHEKVHTELENIIHANIRTTTTLRDRQSYWMGGLAVLNLVLGIIIVFIKIWLD